MARSKNNALSKLARSLDTTGDITADAISPTVSLGADVYASASSLPTSGNNVGDQAYVTGNNRLYIWAGTGWYNVALINRAPTFTSITDSDGGTTPFTLATDGTPTTITLLANDSDGEPLSYSYVADSNFAGLATISGSGTEYTITPLSQDSATTESGTITFKATDGINIASDVNTFTLVFLSPLWDETVLSVATSSTNGLGNSTFIDRSANTHTITLDGSPVQTAFHPYLDNWSVEMNGTSVADYISCGTHNFNGAFTIEFWYNSTETTSANPVFDAGLDLNTNDQTYIFSNISPTSITFGIRNGATNPYVQTSTISINDGQWHHIVFGRDSNDDLFTFVDGVKQTETPINVTFDLGDLPVTFGVFDFDQTTYDAWLTNSYISNLRLVNDVVYTTNFTPPTENLTAITGTSLLTFQSNRFVDNSSSPKTITPNGNSKISAYNPFGQGSEYATGENKGSIASLNQNQEAIYTTSVDTSSDFTLECWVYMDPTTFGVLNQILYLGGGYLDGKGIGFRYRSSALQITAENLVKASVTPFPFNQWVHVAVSISPGVSGTAYVNGEYLGPLGAVSFNSTSPLTVLSTVTSVTWNNDFPMNGYVSDVAITSGLKYTTTSSFTPPTSPVGNTNAELYLPMDNAGIYDKTGNYPATIIGSDTYTDTAIKKYASSSIAFRGVDDNASGLLIGSSNVIGTGDFTIEFWVYHTDVTPGHSMVYFDCRNGGANDANTPGLYLSEASGIYTLGYYVNSAYQILSSNNPFTVNTWYHIALCRSSGSTKMYIDGTQVGTTYADTINYVDQPMYIGRRYTSTGSAPTYYGTLAGNIEGFQILVGTAKYTANFTPPNRTQGINYQAES